MVPNEAFEMGGGEEHVCTIVVVVVGDVVGVVGSDPYVDPLETSSHNRLGIGMKSRINNLSTGIIRSTTATATTTTTTMILTTAKRWVVDPHDNRTTVRNM